MANAHIVMKATSTLQKEESQILKLFLYFPRNCLLIALPCAIARRTCVHPLLRNLRDNIIKVGPQQILQPA